MSKLLKCFFFIFMLCFWISYVSAQKVSNEPKNLIVSDKFKGVIYRIINPLLDAKLDELHQEENLNYSAVTCSASRYFFTYRQVGDTSSILKQYFITVNRRLPDIDRGDIEDVISFHNGIDAIFYVASGLLKSYSVYTDERKSYIPVFNDLKALFVHEGYVYYSNATHVRQMNIFQHSDDKLILTLDAPITSISASRNNLYVAHNGTVTQHNLLYKSTTHYSIDELPHEVYYVSVDLSNVQYQIYLSSENTISAIRERDFQARNKRFEFVSDGFVSIGGIAVVGEFSHAFTVQISWTALALTVSCLLLLVS